MALAGALGLALACAPGAAVAGEQTVKVLSLNVWLDSHQGADKIAEEIKASGADIVGLQESNDHTQELADRLGYHAVQQRDTTAILSRFPIEQVTPNRDAVVVRLDNGKKLAVGNVHLYYKPYQPYQLLKIPYEDAPFIDTEAEAQAEAIKARGEDVDRALGDLETLKGLPRVTTGDHNEPSHLDWTQRAADAGHHPIKVAWPASLAFARAGFKDSYRVLNPDEVAKPGYTWTPTTEPGDPKDHHDRLDFVMYDGPGITPVKVEIVGENSQNADIVVTPYPTDHRGVLTTFKVE